MSLGAFELLVLILFTALAVIPFWRILDKAGFSTSLSLLALIPMGFVVLILVLAFVPWPIFREGA
jgi:hypothetical protein